MPLTISSDAILEYNKLSSDNVQLLLLAIEYPNEDIIRICLNNASVTWPDGGDVYLPAIFTLSGLSESTDADIPGVKLQFVDLSRSLIPLLDANDGGVGAVVTLYVVNSNHLDNATPELKHEFSILDASVTENYAITFTLGAENLLKRICPTHRYLKNRCRFVFEDDNCNYTGEETECDKTFSNCEERENTARFGGFPNIGRSGFLR